MNNGRMMTPRKFRKTIYDFYRANGRDLSWRKTRDPYHIFISEVMLQQTQVESAIPKYERFIAAFPDFKALSRAPLRKILALWKGLGYNRRALYLKKAAEAVMREHGGVLPRDAEKLLELPGVGRATAAAICAYAFNEPVVFIETNIRRTFIHRFFPEQEDVPDNELLPLVARMLDRKNPRRWYNALMDYGAMLKKRYPNPNRRSRHYTKQKPFEGSDREIRGKILEILLRKPEQSRRAIQAALEVDKKRIERCLAGLVQEGILRYAQRFFTIT
ncbi:MAG: A/G-specific adenine glycosylase [Candidatus Niyogibacteria bacterium]|nr:A/G-specific adenine glycosylase [Candidatus Niyogibacteria bacterium]